MNKKIIISIMFIGIIIGFGYVYIHEKNKNHIKIESINQSNTEGLNNNNLQLQNQSTDKIEPPEEISDEILQFNQEVANIFSFENEDSKARAVDTLLSMQRFDSSDVIETINTYYTDISKYQVEIDQLIDNCQRAKKTTSNFEKIISQSDGKLSEESFNQYYFFHGLMASNICKDLATPKDPFFALLTSARNGDILSRLLLIDYLYKAVQRKAIDPWKYPSEYKQIRDEAVAYLRQLAAKGVTRASVKLAQLYAVNSVALPPNKVLEYYYSYLALKQEGIEKVYVKDPKKIYERLSDTQKAIVDRMIERIK